MKVAGDLAERLRFDDRLVREVTEVLSEYRAILLARDLGREREFSKAAPR